METLYEGSLCTCSSQILSFRAFVCPNSSFLVSLILKELQWNSSGKRRLALLFHIREPPESSFISETDCPLWDVLQFSLSPMKCMVSRLYVGKERIDFFRIPVDSSLKEPPFRSLLRISRSSKSTVKCPINHWNIRTQEHRQSQGLYLQTLTFLFTAWDNLLWGDVLSETIRSVVQSEQIPMETSPSWAYGFKASPCRKRSW